MELNTLWTIVRRWGWLALIPVALALLVTLPGLLRGAPVSGAYSTVIRFSAMQSMEAIPRAEGDYQDIWLASEYLVNALTEWMRGGRFRTQIAEVLAREGVTLDPALLGVGADNERSVGQIFLSYPDGETLGRAAEAALTVLRDNGAATFAQLGGQPAQITVLDQTPPAAAPPPLTDRFAPLLRIGVAALAGIGLMFLAYALDPIVRRREDLNTAGVPIIGMIPR